MRRERAAGVHGSETGTASPRTTLGKRLSHLLTIYRASKQASKQERKKERKKERKVSGGGEVPTAKGVSTVPGLSANLKLSGSHGGISPLKSRSF